MRERHLIQKAIEKAWRRCINNDYKNQLINSEHCLQVLFSCYLNQIISRHPTLSKKRRLFIEPEMFIQSIRKTMKPDIVVCNTKKVISVIELKYLPRKQLEKTGYKKDIKKLALIAEHRDQITIANERFRGIEKDNYNYSLSKNILFVWAGVHAIEKSNNQIQYFTIDKSLKGCFIECHAKTVKGGIPIISP